MRYIISGKVIQPHGLGGWVKVAVTSENPRRFQEGGTLILEGSLRRLRVERSRPVHGCLLVKFEGVEDRDQALALKGRELWVTEDEVGPPPPGSFWEHQLLGLEVRTRAGRRLGAVSDILVTGSNDVLVVKGEGEVLIPLLREVVVEVNLEDGVMTVEPLPGLLDEEGEAGGG
jgi:16S rRNA processing protein RimM